MLMLGFVLYGSTTLMPLLLQTLLGYTAMLSGMVLSPGGIVVVICMPIVGNMLRKVQARWMIIFGCLVCSGGLFLMSRFNLYIDYRTAVTSRMVQSLGMAFLFVPISTVAFALIAQGRAPATPPGCSTWRATSGAVRASRPPLPCWRAARSITSRCWSRT